MKPSISDRSEHSTLDYESRRSLWPISVPFCVDWFSVLIYKDTTSKTSIILIASILTIVILVMVIVCVCLALKWRRDQDNIVYVWWSSSVTWIRDQDDTVYVWWSSSVSAWRWSGHGTKMTWYTCDSQWWHRLYLPGVELNGDGTKITLCVCDAGGDSRRLCFSGVEVETGPR